jgi:hypothetical protein
MACSSAHQREWKVVRLEGFYGSARRFSEYERQAIMHDILKYRSWRSIFAILICEMSKEDGER